jgi:hypothetical protein
MTTIATVLERELYSELGQLAAAYRIEARRHFDAGVSRTLEEISHELTDDRIRYWSGKISAGAALACLRLGEAMLEAVAEWDAL